MATPANRKEAIAALEFFNEKLLRIMRYSVFRAWRTIMEDKQGDFAFDRRRYPKVCV